MTSRFLKKRLITETRFYLKLVERLISLTDNLKKSFFTGCSKMPRCKAPEILRSEVYLEVLRNDEE
jgi:hypothetical protein